MEPDVYADLMRTPHPENDDHDTVVAMIYLAARCDCLEVVDMSCFDLFGHDRFAQLTLEELRELHRRIRPPILKRARKLGLLPQFGPLS
jgi:hypothetical protein